MNAVSTVLTVFMAGLALGSHVGGRWADRSRSLLVLYGLLEVVIGVYAFLFPWFVDQGVSLYGLAVRAEAVEFWYSRSIHLVVMGTLLLVPTAAMGATLPLLVRLVSGRLSRVGRWAGWRRDTENQFEDPGLRTTITMYALIVAEIGGFGVLFVAVAWDMLSAS